MYKYPLIPATQKHVWAVKTSTQIEKPRHITLTFQTNRKDQRKNNADRFGHCSITNLKLFSDSQYYPYGNLNLNFDQNQFTQLYEMYANFQFSYYRKEPEPLLKKETFIKYAPIIVIDFFKQNEFLKHAPVDVQLKFESINNFPTNIAVSCLILHDRIVQYELISGVSKE